MKKIHIKKPDLKGGLQKLKNLKKEDIVAHWKASRERRARILEARRNSAFAKKMQPVYAFMNKFSLIFHGLLACLINFVIEAISRHSVFEALHNRWEYYVNQVYEMDQFAGNLVKAIEQRGEPSVVVFYGDHLPTMGLEAKDLKSRYLYNTNYVIWDNIGLEKQDRNIPAYQIMSDVLDRLDIHSGTVFNYHQERRKSKNYLADLELLQYDILYGDQYVYDGKLPITEGHMMMGVKDVTLSNVVSQLNGGCSLYGENFTKQSKVYVNGEKQKSQFLNNTRIDLSETELKEGDVISVRQMGSSDTLFRKANDYIYQQGQLQVVEGTGTDTSISWMEQTEDEKE